MKAPKPSFAQALLNRIFSGRADGGAPISEANDRPEWIKGKRAPVRRRFARHQASCYETPAAAYGPFSPAQFD